MEAAWTHTTVLLSEAIDALLGASAADHSASDGSAARSAPVFVDATFGRGGHSRLILSKLAANARLIAFDKDLDALAEAATIQDERFSIRRGYDDALSRCGIEIAGLVDGHIADGQHGRLGDRMPAFGE